MESTGQNQGLIHTRRGAIVALCLTSYAAAGAIHILFLRSQGQFHWPILEDLGLPVWALAAINAAFYVFEISFAVSMYRMSPGKQRILVAGWAINLLWPFRYLSTSVSTVVRYAEAVGMLVAVFAAIYLVFETPPAIKKPDSRAQTSKAAIAALFGVALVLGFMAAFMESGSNWNDDGLTLGMLALGAAALSLISPRKTWLWALSVYACMPVLYAISPPADAWSSPDPLPLGLNNRVAKSITGTVLYLLCTLAGAYVGMLIRGLLDRRVRAADHPTEN